jgi:arylsulfate sulfotransferase
MIKIRTPYATQLFVPLVIGLMLAACGTDAPETAPTESPATPELPALTISNVSLTNTNHRVPLAALMTLTTSRAATVELLIDDGEKNWSVTPVDKANTEHSLMVLGMRSGRPHTVKAIATDAAGNQAESEPATYTTPPFPEDFVVPDVTVANKALMEPGVTMIELTQWDEKGATLTDFGSAVYILDNAGEVVWYYHAEHGAGNVHRLPNGNLFYYSDGKRTIEMDMLGNIVGQWHATGLIDEAPAGSIPVEVDSFHHEATRLPNGNTLVLSSDPRVLEDYPTSTKDPDAPRETATVIGDILLEFAPDGSIVKEWKLHDIIDPYRISHSSLSSGYWIDRKYEDRLQAPVRDWTHANAMIYDESDHSAIVSLRHQDAVIKVDWESGELIWILGTHDNWKEPWSDKLLTPVGDMQWQYHQHGPSFTGSGSGSGSGTLIMFDNGTNRASAFQEPMPFPESYSRAVEFDINDETREVSQVWEYRGPADEPFFSFYISDTDRLPETGNILITDGGRETGPDGRPARRDKTPDFWSRVLEVTHTEPAEKVFEVIFREPLPKRWHSYRSQHLSSLYP